MICVLGAWGGIFFFKLFLFTNHVTSIYIFLMHIIAITGHSKNHVPRKFNNFLVTIHHVNSIKKKKITLESEIHHDIF